MPSIAPEQVTEMPRTGEFGQTTPETAQSTQEAFDAIVGQLEGLGQTNPELIDTLQATALAKDTGMTEGTKAKPPQG